MPMSIFYRISERSKSSRNQHLTDMLDGERSAPVRAAYKSDEPLGILKQPKWIVMRLASMIHVIVSMEGPQTVAVDGDGQVFSVPDHSKLLATIEKRPFRYTVLGRYDRSAKLGYIMVDLREHREMLRRAI